MMTTDIQQLADRIAEDGSEAEQRLESWLGDEKRGEDEFDAMADALFDRECWRGAVRCLELLRDIRPDSAEYLCTAALAHYNMREYDIAEELGARAIGLDPDRDQAWYVRGISLLELGRAGQAAECFRRLLRRDMRKASWLAGYANALAALGRTAAALACFNRALEYEKADQWIWADAAGLLYSMGLVDEALEYCERAVEVPRGSDGKLLCMAAHMLESKGRYREALERLERVLEYYPEHGCLLRRRGELLRILEEEERPVGEAARIIDYTGRKEHG